MTTIRHEAHPHDDLTRADSPVDAVARATTSVRTNVLERNGIEHLRILSESKFLELLRAYADRRGGDRPTAAREPAAPQSDASTDPVVLEDAYQRKWAELKAQHEASLQRIEGRMEKLSRVFQGLQGILGRSGTPAAQREETQAQPLEPRQRALLREMLLKGELP